MSLVEETPKIKDRHFQKIATVKETNTSRKEQVPEDSKSRTPMGEIRDHLRVAGIGIGY